MCDIYKRGLLLTAQKQFGRDSSVWKLQEDNDDKRTWKVALNWKASHRIQKIDCSLISLDSASIEDVWQLLKMKLILKKVLQTVNL